MKLAEYFQLEVPADSHIELLSCYYVHGFSATSRRLRLAALEAALYSAEECRLLEQAALLLDRPLENGLTAEPDLLKDLKDEYPLVRRRVWEILASL